MKQLVLVISVAALVLSGIQSSPGQVVLVEPGHASNQVVDSVAPIDPSQAALEPGFNVESIGIHPAAGDLYIQLSSGGFASLTTDIFKVTPVGVVSPVVLGTGFGINERGTDLHFDPATGLLVTQDQNFGVPPGRVATVSPTTGAIGTWVPFVFGGGTFGADSSTGAGGSDVPAGEIIFTSDGAANGIHSAPLGGVAFTHLPLPPGTGDDMVIQPDGDWVHVGDFATPLTAYNPAGPEPHATVTSPLNIATMFATAGLPFVFGSRATVCDSTGELYISYSGGLGGSGIFRVDEPLTTATLVLTIGVGGSEGLHDLTLGPSTAAFSGNSVYFTVHDVATGGEEVWEVTVPECPGGRVNEGRMTGGGSVFDAGGTRFTHGFELHCDASQSPNNLQINWPNAAGGSNSFHLESLTSALCTDDPAISEGKPVAGFDTYAGSGSGRMNGESGATVDFRFSDAGEPGKGVDIASISITPPGGGPAIVVSGSLDKGNHQAHK